MTFQEWLRAVPGRFEQWEATSTPENAARFAQQYAAETGDTTFQGVGNLDASLGGNNIVSGNQGLLYQINPTGAPDAIANNLVTQGGNSYINPGIYNSEMAKLNTNDGFSDFVSNYGPLLAIGGGAALAGVAGAAGAASGGTGAPGGLTGLEGMTGYDVAYGSATDAAGGLTGGGGSMIGTGAGADYLGYATNGLLSAPTGAGGAGGGAASSLISGVPNNLLLGGLQAGLGYLGSNAQADAYKDVASQQGAYGAPYRALLEQSYQPGFDLWSQPGYADAANRAADISTRQWAARAGNPAGNPTAQAGIYRDVLNETFLPTLANYRGGLMQGAGMGLNQSGAASLAAANQSIGPYNSIQYGLEKALGPQNSDADILRKYGLTIGGVPS